MLKIHLYYYALLREERGVSQETIGTRAQTPEQLYTELKQKYQFKIPIDLLKVVVNDVFVTWRTPLKPNDTVAFIPPFGGG